MAQTPEEHQLNVGIAALEAQRSVLGDAVVDALLAPAQARLAALRHSVATECAQTLRQVTVLFLDVVGSTTLSQQLDPEDVHLVMDGALARSTAVVESHGGRVLQYAGDSLLAAFGADESREDDAERAVRAGLSLLDVGRELRDEVHRNYQRAGFDVRIGIHTGAVLLGGGVDKEGTIRGLAVNVAARMEQTAPPGSLRISQDTYAHVRGVFEVVPQDPLSVKGVDAPIRSYLVQSARPRTSRVALRGIDGVHTRMIGRDAELKTLQDVFARLYEPAAGLQRVLVVADAGIGKTRLLDEFRTWTGTLPRPFRVFETRATPQTQSQPYGMLRDLLAWQLGIHDGDSMEVARQKLERGISPLFVEYGETEAQMHTHLLGQLIGLDYLESPHLRHIRQDGRQIRNRGFHAAAEALRRLQKTDGERTGDPQTAAIPILIQLDDLHWADDGSLDFFDYLAQVARDVPLLVLGLTRPSLFERRARAAPAATLLPPVRIDLAPLDRQASRELSLELLRKLPEVPAALRELVTGGADGNPYYMEELINMLIDQGGIQTGESWALDAEKLLAIRVPSTLTGILQARLDELPASERHALQVASVIGLQFWDAALAHVEPAAAEQLPPLTERELVKPTAVQERHHEYAFKHQLLHQVTQGTVLKRDKQLVHERVAHWFADASSSRARDFAGAAAMHYEEAGFRSHAAEYYTRAAEFASAAFAHETLLDYTERALNLLEEHDHRTRWRLLANRELSLDLMGRRDAQLADIQELLVIAERIDDDLLRAEASCRRADIAFRTGDDETQEREARRSQALAEKVGATMLALTAQTRVAVALAFQGKLKEGRAIAAEGLARSEALALIRVEVKFANLMGTIASLEGNIAETLDFTLRELILSRQIGDRYLEGVATSNLGISYANLGANGLAKEHLQAALQLNREVGNHHAVGNALSNLSRIAVREKKYAEALTQAQTAVDIFLEVGARVYESDALHFRGQAELGLGQWAEATRSFERMEELEREVGFSPASVFVAIAGQASAAFAGEAVDGLPRALALVERLLDEESRRMNDVGPASDPVSPLAGEYEPEVRLMIYKILAKSDDPRAPGQLQSAYRALMVMADNVAEENLRSGYLHNIPEHREIVVLYTSLASP